MGKSNLMVFSLGVGLIVVALILGITPIKSLLGELQVDTDKLTFIISFISLFFIFADIFIKTHAATTSLNIIKKVDIDKIHSDEDFYKIFYELSTLENYDTKKKNSKFGDITIYLGVIITVILIFYLPTTKYYDDISNYLSILAFGLLFLGYSFEEQSKVFFKEKITTLTINYYRNKKPDELINKQIVFNENVYNIHNKD